MIMVQLAVEAGEKREKTQEQVQELVQVIEDTLRQQQEHAESVVQLQKQLSEVQDPETVVRALIHACVSHT